MKFLLQADCKDMPVEMAIVKDLICATKYANQFAELLLDNVSQSEAFNAYIPVGTIQFVEAWFRKYRGIDNIYPLEIPEFLRTAKFLKRDYRIVPYGEVPREGKWFVKDVTQMKEFTFSGNVEHLWADPDIIIDKSHMFQVSTLEDILSEYRIYFIDGEIENVCNYDGHVDIFPDMGFIHEVNAVYKRQQSYPCSYTMDIMVTEKGTSLIELHPFVAVGLYSTLWGRNLLNAYRDGIRYIESRNKPVET